MVKCSNLKNKMYLIGFDVANGSENIEIFEKTYSNERSHEENSVITIREQSYADNGSNLVYK